MLIADLSALRDFHDIPSQFVKLHNGWNSFLRTEQRSRLPFLCFTFHYI